MMSVPVEHIQMPTFYAKNVLMNAWHVQMQLLASYVTLHQHIHTCFKVGATLVAHQVCALTISSVFFVQHQLSK